MEDMGNYGYTLFRTIPVASKTKVTKGAEVRVRILALNFCMSKRLTDSNNL